MGIITLWLQLQDGWKCEALGCSCAQGHCMHVACINMSCSFLQQFFVVVSWHGAWRVLKPRLICCSFSSENWCASSLFAPWIEGFLTLFGTRCSKYIFLSCFCSFAIIWYYIICYPYPYDLGASSWGKGPFHCTGTPINLSLWWVKTLRKNWKGGGHLKWGQTRRTGQKSWELVREHDEQVNAAVFWIKIICVFQASDMWQLQWRHTSNSPVWFSTLPSMNDCFKWACPLKYIHTSMSSRLKSPTKPPRRIT